MKLISQKQIQEVLDVMFNLNIPIKSYDSLARLFAELPNEKVCEDKTEEKVEETGNPL